LAFFAMYPLVLHVNITVYAAALWLGEIEREEREGVGRFGTVTYFCLNP
jgi:hypothetical protein